MPASRSGLDAIIAQRGLTAKEGASAPSEQLVSAGAKPSVTKTDDFLNVPTVVYDGLVYLDGSNFDTAPAGQPVQCTVEPSTQSERTGYSMRLINGIECSFKGPGPLVGSTVTAILYTKGTRWFLKCR